MNSKHILFTLAVATLALGTGLGDGALAQSPERIQNRQMEAGRFDDGGAGVRSSYATSSTQVQAAGGRIVGTAEAGALTAGRRGDGSTGVRKAHSGTEVMTSGHTSGSVSTTEAVGTTTVRTFQAGRSASRQAGSGRTEITSSTGTRAQATGDGMAASAVSTGGTGVSGDAMATTLGTGGSVATRDGAGGTIAVGGSAQAGNASAISSATTAVSSDARDGGGPAARGRDRRASR